MSNPSTLDKVLNSPELLEYIFARLPERDLLTNAQRVCKLWHTLITASPTLQQILGFQPSPATEGHEGRVNPILNSLFSPWFRSFERDAPRTAITLPDYRSLDWNSSPRKREAYRRKDASWRRMLVIQPPVHKVTIIARLRMMGGYLVGPGMASMGNQGKGTVEEGLRMGVLYDLTLDVTGTPQQDYGWFEFWIDWKRSTPAGAGNKSEGTNAEVIKLYIDYTTSDDEAEDLRLETYFKSLALETLALPMKWDGFYRGL